MIVNIVGLASSSPESLVCASPIGALISRPTIASTGAPALLPLASQRSPPNISLVYPSPLRNHRRDAVTGLERRVRRKRDRIPFRKAFNRLHQADIGNTGLYRTVFDGIAI